MAALTSTILSTSMSHDGCSLLVSGGENVPYCSQNFQKFGGIYDEKTKNWIFPSNMKDHICIYINGINDMSNEKCDTQSHTSGSVSFQISDSSENKTDEKYDGTRITNLSNNIIQSHIPSSTFSQISDNSVSKNEEKYKPRQTRSNKHSSKILKFKKYSDKSVAVFGRTDPEATKHYKEHLKQLGGKFNLFLKYHNESRPGWIFSNKKADQVKQLVKSINIGVIKSS